MLVGPSVDEFTVIPNKTYSGDVCIRKHPGDTILENRTFIYEYAYVDTVIKEFYIEESAIVNLSKDEDYCHDYSFIADYYTNSTENTVTAAIIVSEKNDNSISIGYSHRIVLDTESVSYRHALWNLSKKFSLVFVSIFSVLALLLYIFNKNKLNE